MAKRFGDLEKQALAILASGGNPATSQDTALANYWQWRVNPSANSHNLPAASERPRGRETSKIYLKPFALDLPANILATVTISERSNVAAGATIKEACGLEELVVGTTTGLAIKKFVPARVYWRTNRAEESSPRTSRITNRPYKSYYAAANEGFSVPFGRKSTDSLLKRQNDIKAAIALPKALITFSPEKYRG